MNLIGFVLDLKNKDCSFSEMGFGLSENLNFKPKYFFSKNGSESSGEYSSNYESVNISKENIKYKNIFNKFFDRINYKLGW